MLGDVVKNIRNLPLTFLGTFNLATYPVAWMLVPRPCPAPPRPLPIAICAGPSPLPGPTPDSSRSKYRCFYNELDIPRSKYRCFYNESGIPRSKYHCCPSPPPGPSPAPNRPLEPQPREAGQKKRASRAGKRSVVFACRHTPRFYHAHFCALARCLIALGFKTLAPTVQIGRLKN